ncbi:prepilin-type N-terminal cleavage/methylation domain-containing protein [Patescibacteria group bacterium]|nr:prepilin-type N-terminal cleavage/methylation domain-containing protein [Patescibacteria group bacterium]MBU4580449.1 prepilin-type N-terminal cleavage/methylation domain-containing protein [Patescibacteria group bacterium]
MLNKEKGFTLIEIIIVIAIISIIAVISIVSWRSFSDVTNLGNTAKMIEIKIKLAKSYSLSALNDVNYGVHLEAANVTIFPANVAYNPVGLNNQVFALTDGVEIYSGAGNNIVFSRLTGVTDDAGAIGIRIIKRPSKTKTISINAQGQTGTDSFEASSIPPIVEDTANNINARHIHFNLSAWSIQSNPPITDLIFRKGDGTLIESINTASFFNAGIFDWQGSVTVDAVAQNLRIHTLDTNGTTLCVIRDRMQNSKTIKISFIDSGITKEIVTYTENVDGTVTVSPNYSFVDNPIEAQ